MKRAREGLRRHWSEPLYRNAYYLMLASWTQLALGGVFWLVAARTMPAAQVGWGATTISVSSLVAFLGSLGLGWGLTRFLPGAAPAARGALIIRSWALTAVATAVLATLALAGYATFLGLGPATPGAAIAFVGYAVILSWQLQAEGMFMAGRAAHLAFWAAALVGILRIALLVLLRGHDPVGFLVAWCTPSALMLATLFPALARRLGASTETARWVHFGQVLRHSIIAHAGFLTLLAATLSIPALILSTSGPEEAAVYYVAFSLATIVFGISNATARSLLVEGGRSVQDFPRSARRAFAYASSLAIAASLVLFAFARPLLAFIGDEYASAWMPLALLAMSTPFVVLRSLTEAYLSVTERLGDLFLIAAGTGVLYVVLGFPAGLAAAMGVSGVALAWLLANVAAAFYSVVRYATTWRRATAPNPASPAMTPAWE